MLYVALRSFCAFLICNRNYLLLKCALKKKPFILKSTTSIKSPLGRTDSDKLAGGKSINSFLSKNIFLIPNPLWHYNCRFVITNLLCICRLNWNRFLWHITFWINHIWSYKFPVVNLKAAIIRLDWCNTNGNKTCLYHLADEPKCMSWNVLGWLFCLLPCLEPQLKLFFSPVLS